MSLFDMPILHSSAGKDAHSTQKIHSILSTEHTSRSDKLRNLDEALDQIRKKYGDDAVKRGTQL